MNLCVLICTHNRLELLRKTLASLGTAVPPARMSLEILVVANACTDDSVAWLESLQGTLPGNAEVPLRWIEERRIGKTYALNLGVNSTEADVVAFVDDDHRVDPGYLAGVENSVGAFPKISLFCGRIQPDWDGTEPPWVRDTGPYRIYPLPVPRFDQGEEPHEIFLGGAVPGGGNLFLRRDVFRRVGGFREELGPRGHNLSGGEDSEFVVRALRSGERLRYVPSVVQYHYVDQDRLKLAYLLRKSYERSRAAVLFSGKGETRIRPYSVRKLLRYLTRAVFCMSWQGRRFYLMRVAATLGEIDGLLKRRTVNPPEERSRVA